MTDKLKEKELNEEELSQASGGDMNQILVYGAMREVLQSKVDHGISWEEFYAYAIEKCGMYARRHSVEKLHAMFDAKKME